MTTSLNNASSQASEASRYEQLHQEVAAFNEEMRQAQLDLQDGRRPALRSFILGAVTAATTFAAAAVLLHI